MIAVTIASDLAYRRMAELAAESVRWSTGLQTAIIEHASPEPAAFRKLSLLSEFPGQTVLFFDADTRFLRPWDVSAFDDQPYVVGVCDVGQPKAVAKDCHRYAMSADRYINSGLWIANQRHEAAWRLAAQIARAPDYATSFQYEQTALNAAIHQQFLQVYILDRRYNWMCGTVPPSDVTVLHCAGGSLHSPNRRLFEKVVRDARSRA